MTDRNWVDAELQLEPDPFASFLTWYAAAEAVTPQPQAMGLATVDAQGRPSLRMVNYRGLSEGGLRFFTNYGSRKSGELTANPYGALLFYWQPLRRQVRVEGAVESLAPEESDAYFAGRDRETQLGAWASRQSEPLPSREVLQRSMDALRLRFADAPVPRPEFWGGYRLVPSRFEFWQNRPNRLHDRFRYDRNGDRWQAQRLSP